MAHQPKLTPPHPYIEKNLRGNNGNQDKKIITNII